MKTVIQLLVILATLVGMITWALSANSLDEGNTIASAIYGLFFLLTVIALILLFRWDKKRINNEEIELRQRVEEQIKEALRYKQPVEFHIKQSQITFLIFMLALGLGAIYFCVQQIRTFPAPRYDAPIPHVTYRMLPTRGGASLENVALHIVWHNRWRALKSIAPTF